MRFQDGDELMSDDDKVVDNGTESVEEFLTSLQKMESFDKDELLVKINKFLDIKMANEYIMMQSIKTGVLEELRTEGKICYATVEHMSKILRASKDSVPELVKVKQLLEGKATSITDVNFVDKLRKARSRVPNVFGNN